MVSAAELKKVGLFEKISSELCGKIAEIAEEMEFSQGSLIFREGTLAKYIYILLDGKVTIRIHLTSRPESVAVSVVNKPYHCFGWSSIVAPYHFTASARCEADCRLVAIPGKELMEILEQYPASGFHVMCGISEILSSRLRNSRQVLLKSL